MQRHVALLFSVSLALVLLVACGSAEPTAIPTAPAAGAQASAAYLGQPTPGPYPKRFAPAVIKGDLHTAPVFSPDGTEIYWAMQGEKIFRVRLENGQWTQPESVVFSTSMTDYRDPFISPSGDRLFFLSRGKLPGSALPEKENIWFVERTAAGWGQPQPLSETVNSLELHWQVSVAANGNLYFTSPPFSGDIHVSRYVNGEYARPEKLGDGVNSEIDENTPYVAPDESYIIFARFKTTSSNPQLYISYADKDGRWGKAVLIDNIGYGLCPVVSPDGKYLFFLSSPQSVSWMSAEFIHDLKR